jgi:hypothetical protein
MPHPSLALQKAVVAALAADAALAAIIDDRVHDGPPRNAEFPYVAIGQASLADWSTGTEAGAEHRLLIDVWSREPGKRQCYEIMDAIEAALHDAALTLDGHTLVNLRFEFADARRDPDGITYHGVVRFRAVTENTP